MSIYQSQGSQRNPLLSFLIVILILVGIYYAIKGLYWLLYILSPVLLIAAVVLHYPTVLSHGKGLLDGVRREPFTGVLSIVLQAICFPFVFAWILLKAYANRRIGQMQRNSGSESPFGNPRESRESRASISSNDDEYIDFEEVPKSKQYSDDDAFGSGRRTDPGRSDSYSDLFK